MSEQEDSSSTTTDLTSLRKLVSQATTLHTKNLSASNIDIQQLTSRITDLQTESSQPNFWDTSNSQRTEIVTRELTKYTKLKEQMELWGRLRNDSKDALELLG